MLLSPWLNAWPNVKNHSRYMLPSAALIQPCRGAPPEPLGEGTQASFQPSLKSVEHGSGRQVSGSGLPKIDSLIVSMSPVSTRVPAGTMPMPSTYKGWGPVVGPPIVSAVDTESTMSAKSWVGIPEAGNGGDGSCARARPANVKMERASAVIRWPPRVRRVWLPAIGRPS